MCGHDLFLPSLTDVAGPDSLFAMEVSGGGGEIPSHVVPILLPQPKHYKFPLPPSSYHREDLKKFHSVIVTNIAVSLVQGAFVIEVWFKFGVLGCALLSSCSFTQTVPSCRTQVVSIHIGKDKSDSLIQQGSRRFIGLTDSFL